MQKEFRKIIHVDMDAFYASIEQRDKPELRGKPVVVGSPKARGVIAAASYEARKYGVRSAMPAKVALRKCPHLVFASSRFEVYKEVSSQIHQIFRDYTELIEPLAFDEAFLDVTHNKVGQRSATLIAQDIKNRIKQELNLTASAGVSYCKFLSKIASDWNKPDGLFTITPSKAEAFIEKLPIEKFFGVGARTAEKMHRMKIFNGADLKRFDEVELIRRFGKAGVFYYKIVRGIDERPVRVHRERKSVGAERTFESDITNKEDLEDRMLRIIDTLWERVEKKKYYGKTATLKVKFADFQQITRSETLLAEITNKRQLENIIIKQLRLVDCSAGVRLLGASVSNFPKEDTAVQLTFDF